MAFSRILQDNEVDYTLVKNYNGAERKCFEYPY